MVGWNKTADFILNLNDSFLNSLSSTKHLFESYFESQIPIVFHPISRITDACIYSLKAGGKRIRPIFLLQSFYRGKNFPQSIEDSDTDLLLLAFAIECIHTYSLIHDDLPAMDNDDTRRGFPTCHIQFDEATAILAGDALNSLAFSLVAKISSRSNDTDGNLIKDLIHILHNGAGLGGMILGQNLDLLQEKSVRECMNIILVTDFRSNDVSDFFGKVGVVIREVCNLERQIFFDNSFAGEINFCSVKF